MTQYKKLQLELLECNIDDMSPELYPHVMERLFESGARDVWLQPIIMKKGRPAHTLSVLCESSAKDLLLSLIFQETTTLGVRIAQTERCELERSTETLETQWGPLPIKVGRTLSGEIINAAPEYEACRKAALEHRQPLKRIFLDALAAWKPRR